jgi:hypothetical protein
MNYNKKIATTLFNKGFNLDCSENFLISEIFKIVCEDFENKTQRSFIMNDPDFIADVLDELA